MEWEVWKNRMDFLEHGGDAKMEMLEIIEYEGDAKTQVLEKSKGNSHVLYGLNVVVWVMEARVGMSGMGGLNDVPWKQGERDLLGRGALQPN